MTPDEILQVYEAGPEAVIALVTRLLGIISEQSQQIALLQQQNEHLMVRVQALEAQVQVLKTQLAKDSHNSGKPPSSDGLKKPAPKSLRTPSGKRPGGQPGHPGSSLAWSQTPDQIIEHRPECCASCGQPFTSEDTIGVQSRQVQDLPPLRLVVAEHQAYTCRCVACQQQTTAEFPVGVEAPVQYGAQVKALGVYLTCYQLLPFARSAQLLHDLLGVSFSPGALSTAQEQCHFSLEPVTQQIKAALIKAPQVHFDETGARIAGHLHWLHVATTPQMTYYETHPKRGRQATEAIGILPRFRGRAVHDGFATYRTYNCSHALCNAHHLRELTFLAEEGGFLWAQVMKRLLQEMKAAVDQAKEQGKTDLSPPVKCNFEERYQKLLAQGHAAHPPSLPSGKRGRPPQSAGHNLVERLDTFRVSVLAFVHDFSVPFDNNLAERDLRMMKLRLKISGGFRTENGAAIFCRIRGYLSTMLKQGHHAISVLTALLNQNILYPDVAT
ncbi:MAG: IS66 family transposase [Ktedonobacteraceae bacterium]|nr:IS66 family transposase [Ktedonobacteraceae bacterium]